MVLSYAAPRFYAISVLCRFWCGDLCGVFQHYTGPVNNSAISDLLRDTLAWPG
jgi:hypothetical protein